MEKKLEEAQAELTRTSRAVSEVRHALQVGLFPGNRCDRAEVFTDIGAFHAMEKPWVA